MRSSLCCLVTPYGSAPKIIISPLLILKGDVEATFLLSCELITLNVTYGDQLIRGEDAIRDEKSSAFHLRAEGGAPAPPRHDFFAMVRIYKGPFVGLESIE